ncbi:hypothetical protein ABN056_12465 [Providencia vermicola]|uniref:Uncharacterized protein n=1 Tax=Providencia stuartii TaxID=588 RepID=A0ABD5LD45_PROST|nr:MULTISPECIES: hypothetical protein [Providencia]ELR5045324.1 hypothetical protein [Providencia rettgeri]ELR5122561.1 hypothetical protein [Providencia stuartii]ELR5143828.1 hypothetical protein [Providencia stuartii]ELR5292856.1 hypothetical protein [Providencia stuartii]MCR4181535.1 hypothetical protein [Providencia vermicola]
MSEKMQPDIQQTAREKVLIKHNTISAFRYAKHITKQAHKQVTENYQKAQQEIEHIRHVAYQQGYQDGLKQLLSNMIESIEMSEKRFQQQLSQSKEQLLHQLSEFFHDKLLQTIIAEHFIQQSNMEPAILYLPSSLQENSPQKNAHIKFIPSQNEDIALEIGNEIIHFSPSIAVKHLLPQLLSIPSRCQVLAERKIAYQTMRNNLNQGETNDYAAKK